MLHRARFRKDYGLNTTLLPSWRVQFADGYITDSQENSWADFSELVRIDDAMVYLSKEPIESITVYNGNYSYALDMEEPERCFGLHHWRMQFEPEWSYSIFGFFKPDTRVILQVNATAGRVVLQKRSTPFRF
jgi:hypothetical protein